MSDSTKTLKISNLLRSIEFNSPTNVLDLLNKNKIYINQSCGGSGSCSTCQFIVLGGENNLSPRTEIESERAVERNFAQNERLACQTVIVGSIEIQIAATDD